MEKKSSTKSKKTIRVYEITNKGIEAYEIEKERHKEIFTQSFLIMEILMGDLYKEFEIMDFSDLDLNKA